MMADAQVLLKAKINLPGPNDSLRIVRCMLTLLRVVLPVGHPLTVYVGSQHKVMKDFNPNWSNYMTYKPSQFRLKGILHLKHVGNKFNKFLTAINCGLPVPTLDPCEIVDAILDQRQWKPLISPAFELRYNLQHFAQLPQPDPNLPPPPVAGASGVGGGATPRPTPPITPPIIPEGG